MKLKQITAASLSEVEKAKESLKNESPSLIILFGSKDLVESEQIRNLHSDLGVPVVGCSTAGEISENGVFDDTVVITSIEFESKVDLFFPLAKVGNDGGSTAGKELGSFLKNKNVKLLISS